jgi:hypothetical protein
MDMMLNSSNLSTHLITAAVYLGRLFTISCRLLTGTDPY